MASCYEFDVLQDILGFDFMAYILGVSREELLEYDAHFNSMPLKIMARLDFIIKLVRYLEREWNDDGVRSWFFRQRAQLSGMSPVQIFGNMDDWIPEDPMPQKILCLAELLDDANST